MKIAILNCQVHLKGELMKPKISIAGLFLFFVIFSSCQSTKAFKDEPAGESSETLLIGNAAVFLENFNSRVIDGFNFSGLDGKYTQNFDVLLYNIDSKQAYTLKSKINGVGLFYSTELPPGNYYFVGLYLIKRIKRKTGDQIMHSRIKFFEKANKTFEVKSGVVNNLGEITLSHKFEYAIGDGKVVPFYTESIYSSGSNFTDIKNWFNEKYPGSLWNLKTWIDTELY